MVGMQEYDRGNFVGLDLSKVVYYSCRVELSM